MQPVFRTVDRDRPSPRSPLRPVTRPAGKNSRFPPRKSELRDPAILDRLRAAIRRIEGTGPTWSDGQTAVLPLGIGEIDAHLPAGGLPAGALHEIVAADTGMAGVASAFSAYLASLSENGPVLWCEGARILDAGALHPPGLRRFGLDPGRLVVARTRNDAETLWAMEDGLRCAALAAVVGALAAVSLTESRRLQRAAEASGVTALMLRPPGVEPVPNAATTRWRVGAAEPGGDGIGFSPPGWRIEMFRCRGGLPGIWDVEWRDETRGLALAAALCDRQAESDRRAV